MQNPHDNFTQNPEQNFIQNPNEKLVQTSSNNVLKNTGISQATRLAIIKWADYSGRSSRAEFWFFCLATNILYSILSFLPAMPGIDLLIGISVILLIVPSITISIRRLHDINYSGFRLFWFFLPIIGGIMLIYWHCRKGDAAPNKFGNPPLILPITTIDKVLIVIYILLFFVIFLLILGTISGIILTFFALFYAFGQ